MTTVRTVGSIAVSHSARRDTGAGFPTPSSHERPPTLYYRAGIIMSEEGDPAGAVAPAIDLFDQEHLREYEWVWLHQEALRTDGVRNNFDSTGDPVVNREWGDTNIPIDSRIKRKLGAQDSLYLYQQVKTHLLSTTSIGFEFAVWSVHQIRTLVRV